MRVLFAKSVIATVLTAIGIVSASAGDLYTKAALADGGTLPAVDGINAEISGLGGTVANRTVYGTEGAVTLPVGHSFGVQIDGAGGSFDNRTFGAIGGHGFWRDPSRGLLGAYGSYTNWDNFGGLRVGRGGGEAAAYIGRWTFEGVAGVESGNTQTALVGANLQTFSIKTRFFDKADVAYYLSDDWKVSVGHSYFGGNHAAILGTEYALRPLWRSGLGMSLFTEARLGENKTSGVFGGLKFYFGQKDKTLIRRNREDDPTINLVDGLSGLSNNASNTASPAPPVCPPPTLFINGRCQAD